MLPKHAARRRLYFLFKVFAVCNTNLIAARARKMQRCARILSRKSSKRQLDTPTEITAE